MTTDEQYSPVASSSTGFPKPQWEAVRDNSRELETSGKSERGMMGTSVEREWGVMGRESSPLPITPFVPAFLNN